MITGMFNSGALPSLERMVQFTSQRHQLLTHNIANLSTPYYKPVDLDPKAFQAELGRAIDERRSRRNPDAKPLAMRDTRQLRFGQNGIKQVRPDATGDNILFHDQNNRDLDRTMQRLAENTLAHNTAIELIRNQLQMLRTAIREQV